MTNGWDTGARGGQRKRFIWIGKSFKTGMTYRFRRSIPADFVGRIPEPDAVLPAEGIHARGIHRVHVCAIEGVSGIAAVLDKLARMEKYFIGSINNEPLELNEYRIKAFHLRRDFQVFFSSCYLHTRKPEEMIYRIALEVTQRAAGNACS